MYSVQRNPGNPITNLSLKSCCDWLSHNKAVVLEKLQGAQRFLTMKSWVPSIWNKLTMYMTKASFPSCPVKWKSLGKAGFCCTPINRDCVEHFRWFFLSMPAIIDVYLGFSRMVDTYPRIWYERSWLLTEIVWTWNFKETDIKHDLHVLVLGW